MIGFPYLVTGVNGSNDYVYFSSKISFETRFRTVLFNQAVVEMSLIPSNLRAKKKQESEDFHVSCCSSGEQDRTADLRVMNPTL
jgi:hypothetical protein